VKNYGKAMCSFGASDLALPFLKRLSPCKLKNFQAFLRGKKNSIDSIEALRGLLLPSETDSDDIVLFKEIFREIGIIFIKFYSVNWIFHGKMGHKRDHLNARFKMLRRVQNPEYFTYFRGFTKGQPGKKSK